MKTITQLFNDAWEKKEKRKWEYVYIMVDLHGVVLPSNYHSYNDLQFTNPHAEEVLRYLSNQDDIILIMWTSSHESEISVVRLWLMRKDIGFSYVNQNPLEKNTEYADFSQKPYFSIVLDDKAGFDPDVDWQELSTWITDRERSKLR